MNFLYLGKVGVPQQLVITKNPSTIPYEVTKAGMKLPLGIFLFI
jgi:inositol-1,3,4-trisphosphate 5/6-kinase/inositol-tetrakisphosphate 1-kinase